jgi:argininosuccinate lyase
MKCGVALAELPLAEFQAAHASFDARVFDVLGARQAVAAFSSFGSTNPTQVAHQLDSWRKRLEQDI